MTRTLLLALSLLLPLASAASQVTSKDSLLTAVDQQIIPAYQQFQQHTQALLRHSKRFCAAPDPQTLQTVRDGFLSTVNGWQHAQTIRFGPVDFALRLQRIQLWPDKRGSVGKHLQRLLAGQQPEQLQPDNFSSGSVAVQGLSAMERLLYGPAVSATAFSGDTAADYRCAVLLAIADNLNTIAGGIIDDWLHNTTAYRHAIALAATDQDNDFFENRQEIDSKLLNALYTQLQIIVEQKLDRPLGSSLQDARGKRAENWRSGQSLNNIQANLDAVQQLYQLAFATRLRDAALDQAIQHAFTATRQAAAAVPLPLNAAVQSADARPAVITLRQQANQLKTLFGQKLPKATAIPLGFNSLDGD